MSQALEKIARGQEDLTRSIDIQSQVTGEVAQNTTAIKDVADELAEEANQSLAQAKDLHEQAGKLNGLVSGFILK